MQEINEILNKLFNKTMDNLIEWKKGSEFTYSYTNNEYIYILTEKINHITSYYELRVSKNGEVLLRISDDNYNSVKMLKKLYELVCDKHKLKSEEFIKSILNNLEII